MIISNETRLVETTLNGLIVSCLTPVDPKRKGSASLYSQCSVKIFQRPQLCNSVLLEHLSGFFEPLFILLSLSFTFLPERIDIGYWTFACSFNSLKINFEDKNKAQNSTQQKLFYPHRWSSKTSFNNQIVQQNIYVFELLFSLIIKAY